MELCDTLYLDVPAVAMLVHGDEDAGRRVFLQQMMTMKQVKAGRPPQVGRPSSPQYDLGALTQWVGRSLGVLSPGQTVETPQALAERVYAELKSQQLCFVLDQVHRLTGGAVAFHLSFWQPFYQRLQELRAQQLVPHRLIGFVVDYTREDEVWGAAASPYNSKAGQLDYSRLLMLPKLALITENDLYDWFDELAIPDNPPGQRVRLVKMALQNEDGEDDGTPLRVFERLRNEILWPEGANS